MKINRSFVEAVQKASNADDLIPLVQGAIELEHATIPPYLCGYFTLKTGTNTEAAQIIRSVVIEEMLHMTHACNLLIALGGRPVINKPGFVPDYPGGLPMGIGDGLQVYLRKCSVEQVRDVFMAIEAPEEAINIPKAKDEDEAMMRSAAMAETLPDFDNIGAFYAFLGLKIQELGPKIFVGDPADQVVPKKWFPEKGEMFPITDEDSALAAIDVIVDQGEGTHTDPFDEFGMPAHYYRFEEIVMGRKLIRKPELDPPYIYGGDPVVLDTANIWDMDDNPAIAKYRPGSRSQRMAIQFSYSYTRLLNALHQTFNGDPAGLDNAMGVMYELRLLSQQVLATPAEWADPTNTAQAQTGLSFEFQELNT